MTEVFLRLRFIADCLPSEGKRKFRRETIKGSADISAALAVDFSLRSG